MEAIAISFTFALFDGLLTAFIDFLYCNLKIIRKIISKHKMAAFNGSANKLFNDYPITLIVIVGIRIQASYTTSTRRASDLPSVFLITIYCCSCSIQ